MGLEVATYISDLDPSNPVGSTDKVQTLDDHVRLLKSAIKATFPLLTGALTSTHTELNYVTGVTSAIQTQLNAKASATALDASALTSGTVPDARFPATLPAISGANLTALNASNLGSGTVPDARFPATLPALNGSLLTSLNGTNVGSGTVADARLSANVALYNATSVTVSWLPTTPNASAAELGTKGAVGNDQSSNYNFVAADGGGKLVRYIGTGGHTFTIPQNTLFAGAVIYVLNQGSGNLSIDDGSGVTLYLNGTGFATTGARTLATGNMCAIVFFGNANNAVIMGPVS